MPQPLDPELNAFVRKAVRSVWALEVLLLLRQRSPQALGRQELVHELRASDAVVTTSTRQLEAAGLITCEVDGDCRYAPTADVLRQLCDALDETYRERPLAVVNAILLGPNESLRTFADAFRLNTEKDE